MNIVLMLGMKRNYSRKYLKDLPAKQRKKLAASVKPKPVSHEYLYMIGAETRTPSRRLALQLEMLTRGRIKAADFNNELSLTA